jgi:hypothetical protein
MRLVLPGVDQPSGASCRGINELLYLNGLSEAARENSDLVVVRNVSKDRGTLDSKFLLTTEPHVLQKILRQITESAGWFDTDLRPKLGPCTLPATYLPL